MGRRGGEHILQPLAPRNGYRPSFFPSLCLLQPQPSCPPTRSNSVVFQQPYGCARQVRPCCLTLLLFTSSLASQSICRPTRSATINTRGKVFFLMFSRERLRGSTKHVPLSQRMLYVGQGRTVSSNTPEEPAMASQALLGEQRLRRPTA